MFTIRQTLTGLFLLLGLGLCISVAIQAWTAFDQYRIAQALTTSNLAREQLARAGTAIAEERTEAYLALLGASVVEHSAAELRGTTDAVFQEAAGTLTQIHDGASEAVLARLQNTLSQLRDDVDARRSMADVETRAAFAPELLTSYSQLIEDLISLRVALLLQEHPPDAETANAFQMRRFATILLEGLTQNEALFGSLLVERSPEVEREAWDQIRGNAERAQLAYELLEDRTSASAREVRLKLASLDVAYNDRYRPLEQDLLTSLLDQIQAPGSEGIRSEAYRLLWSTRQITRIGAELQDSLFAYSRDRLARQQRTAALRALLWLNMLFLGLVVVARGAWVVRNRVILSLEHLRHSMLALAGGDLKAPLPDRARADEIGAMADALRVFKAMRSGGRGCRRRGMLCMRGSRMRTGSSRKIWRPLRRCSSRFCLSLLGWAAWPLQGASNRRTSYRAILTTSCVSPTGPFTSSWPTWLGMARPRRSCRWPRVMPRPKPSCSAAPETA